ncbi:MAG: hypothetical protein KDE68_03755 [Rhodocyclaceae bacterium]|nr:hypothetical protein [Rhodocyclaceae bacterium]
MDERYIAERTAQWYLPDPARSAVEAALQALTRHDGEVIVTVRKRRARDGLFIILATAESIPPATGHHEGVTPMEAYNYTDAEQEIVEQVLNMTPEQQAQIIARLHEEGLV